MKDLKMYINGEFVESSNGKYIEVLNPSTEEVISGSCSTKELGSNPSMRTCSLSHKNGRRYSQTRKGIRRNHYA